MTPHAKVQELLTPMRERRVDLDSRRFKVEREKVVSAMVGASLAVGRVSPARLRVYAAIALAASFALLAAGFGYQASRPLAVASATTPQLSIFALQGEVTRIQGSSRAAIVPGQPADIGAEGLLETSAGSRARIRTVAGLEFELRENTRVSLADLNSASPDLSLRLFAGAVRCVVRHLPLGRTFSVITEDARIVDRGTVFTVAVDGSGAATKTAVHVEEGAVSVLHATGVTELSATRTQSWVSAAAEPAIVASPEALPLIPEATTTRRSVTPQKARRGTLDEETLLLRGGLASERSGELSAAAKSFESLLTRYPESPLAPDARAALARVKGHQRNGQ